MSKENTSLVTDFTKGLMQMPVDILKGAMKSIEDEDGKLIIESYSEAFTNHFVVISKMIVENANSASRETMRGAEELLQVTSGTMLTGQVQKMSLNLGSSIGKLGLAGIVKMIKKIIKWLVETIFKRLPKWLNNLIDLIDEILNELLGIGNPNLANLLSQKEVNYRQELTALAIHNREEQYLHEYMSDEDL